MWADFGASVHAQRLVGRRKQMVHGNGFVAVALVDAMCGRRLYSVKDSEPERWGNPDRDLLMLRSSHREHLCAEGWRCQRQPMS